MDFTPAKKESEEMEDSFDEADAALVLTSISCSPPVGMSIQRNRQQSQPLSSSLPPDIGISISRLANVKPETKTKYYQCLWKQPKCSFTTKSHEEISQHVRTVHLNNGRTLRDRRNHSGAMQVDGGTDANNISEEDFYFEEVDQDVMDSFVNSFHRLQTASPPEATFSIPGAHGPTFSPKFGISQSQHSPDSAYGSVPATQHCNNPTSQNTNFQMPSIPVSSQQPQDFGLLSQSLPSQLPLELAAMNSHLGLGRDGPVNKPSNPNFGAAVLSVLQQFNQNSMDKTQDADLSTSLPSNWLLQPQQFSSPNNTGVGVPFHLLASAVANNNSSASSDPNIPNSFCMSSSPPSTNSPSPPPPAMAGSLPSTSPLKHHRRIRSDVKKCRKVYGVEKRELWCTQCRWKKACTRFME